MLQDSNEVRHGDLEEIRRHPEVSVLIVGGGINGAGLFRDLALQGVDVLLVERGDFCSGASAASSRMIHGGLRYLEFGEFRLVRESLLERNLLLENAPHYVFPLPTAIPIFSWFSGIRSVIGKFLGIGAERPAHRGALMVKIGLTFYDLFTWKSRLMPRHTLTSRAASLAKRPALNPATIRTATYYDAWISYPERLCLEVLLDADAANSQARALNYVSLQKADGDTVALRDELTGETLSVRSQFVVNATGAWIDFANRAIGHETRMIGGTKGAHLVIENDDLYDALQGEMVYFENSDGRVAVALPWLGKCLVGSTDIRIDNPDEARCEEEEIDYILEAMREVFPTLTIEQSQIVSVFSGVRPLPWTDASSTVQISRDHDCRVTEPTDGSRFPVYSLIGGKWTTFRGFAEQVADQLLRHLGRTRKSDTTTLAIGGGKDFPKDDAGRREWISRLQEETRLPEKRLETLLGRYGTRAAQVAGFLVEGEDRPLRHHDGYSVREIEFIVRNEHVARLADVVLRRTSMALLGELTRELLEELAGIVAPLRQWCDEARQAEIDETVEMLRDRHRIVLS